jgi:tetratricopeptide (TPR) repeat protein
MPRPAPVRAWFLALVAAAASVPGCSAPPSPEPTKVGEMPANLAPDKPPPPPGPSPFYSPDRQAPPARSEPQLPQAELDAALAAAAEALKVGDETTATLRLRACANRVPQSIRCEGELAMLLVKQRRHAAEARYYIEQALTADDPALDDTYYRRFGAAMMAQGRAKEATTAYERMMARITPSAADWYTLSEALQGVPERLQDAADAARKAYELDPSHLDWLRTEAILLGQIPDKIAQAITLFEAYREKTRDPAMIADTDRRIAELRSVKPENVVAGAKGKRKKVARTPAAG